jgi:hypothetical protein
MKIPYFIIAFLIFIQLCAAQTVKNSLSIQHLKGKVKKIESKSYDGDPNAVKLDTLTSSSGSIDLFDENGNEVELDIFGKDGSMLLRLIKKYNEKNENIEEDDFDKSGVKTDSIVFKYDATGNLTQSDRTSIQDKTNSQTLYKYDDKGNNIEDNIFRPDGSLQYKDIYKYDSKGNKIEMDYFHAKEDTMRVKWTFIYNDAGIRVEEGRHKPTGELQIENTFTYENPDMKGNWLLETRKSKGQNKEFANHLTSSFTVRKIYYY